MDDAITRNKLDGFLDESDVVASQVMTMTDYDYLTLVNTMESGKRIIQISDISGEEVDSLLRLLHGRP